MNSKTRKLYFLVGFAFIFNAISLGLTASNTTIYCSTKSPAGNSNECLNEYVSQCKALPGVTFNVQIYDYEARVEIVCPWLERASVVGLMSSIIAFVCLGLFLLPSNDTSFKSLYHFFGLSFFASFGCLAAFILMVLAIKAVNDTSPSLIYSVIGYIMPFNSSNYSVSMTQSSQIANFVFVLLTSLMIISLTVYKIVMCVNNRKRNAQNMPPAQTEVSLQPKSNPKDIIEKANKDSIEDKGESDALAQVPEINTK